MIWLLPAAASSIAIAIILKVNERWRGDRLLLAGANYIVASLLALAFLGFRIHAPAVTTVWLGSVTGVDYVLALLVLMAGISKGPLAVPVTVMRLSVALPVVFSIIFWGEKPLALQWAGMVLGAASFIFFGIGISGKDRAGNAGRGFWPLMISLFLVTGIASVLLKSFSETLQDVDRMSFTWVLFTVAALFTWIIIAVRRVGFDRRTFFLGMLLGVPNLFSTVFTLIALRTVPASVVFPFINVTVISGSAFAAFYIWKEKLGRMALLGLAAAAAALVLLTVK
ncbi:MAG: EamA family transporter [Candidatus Krumholzibacteriota bacterium]|nr:EamA family transporter [Candidatus Krumholzibacteriota bacterium]